jgi:uncharacterized metal-binding protein YceD (DUF177 family)
MNQNLNIYIDRLREGNREVLTQTLSPSSIDLVDDELSFPEPIFLEGEANIAGKELVLHLSLSTEISLFCNICAQPLKKKLQLQALYHIVPLEEVTHAVYNCGHWIRETILLEAPRYAECEENCPERLVLKKYFSTGGSDPGQNPFSSL